jgi:hypothetical protein
MTTHWWVRNGVNSTTCSYLHQCTCQFSTHVWKTSQISVYCYGYTPHNPYSDALTLDGSKSICDPLKCFELQSLAASFSMLSVRGSPKTHKVAVQSFHLAKYTIICEWLSISKRLRNYSRHARKHAYTLHTHAAHFFEKVLQTSAEPSRVVSASVSISQKCISRSVHDLASPSSTSTFLRRDRRQFSANTTTVTTSSALRSVELGLRSTTDLFLIWATFGLPYT